MDIASMARVAHEVHRAYCLAIEDDSQPSWKDAPEWQRQSSMRGVVFYLNSPEASVTAGHNAWMERKLQDGWQWGPEKNPDLKQHPCLIEFRLLPEFQQVKDFLFRAVVKALSSVPP